MSWRGTRCLLRPILRLRAGLRAGGAGCGRTTLTAGKRACGAGLKVTCTVYMLLPQLVTDHLAPARPSLQAAILVFRMLSGP